MSSRSLAGPLALGLALTGATGVCLYLLLRREEEEAWAAGGGCVTSRMVALEVRIPKESVGMVIGRQGANIREIQAKTETRIDFKDDLETEEFRVAVVRGPPDSAQMAEILIHQTIAQQPRVEKVTMSVPTRTVGRIIGRGGETVRSISRASRCKVDVDRQGEGYETRILLAGSSDAISSARRMIEEKVEEDTAVRELGGARLPRLKHHQPLFLSHEPEEPEEPPSLQGEQEELRPTGLDSCIEVFVSAVSSPGCFWVQKIGPHSVELDRLTQEMTDYYGDESHLPFHQLSTAAGGDVVVTRFQDDPSYYRARVVAFKEDSYDAARSTVDLDFVDFGDAEEKCISEVFTIRTEYLRLKFQAVQCCLARLRPAGGEEGWSDEAVSQFESLSHCALWKVLWAKVVEHPGQHLGRVRVPGLQLVDSGSPGLDRDLGQELVRLGLAEEESKESNESGDN